MQKKFDEIVDNCKLLLYICFVKIEIENLMTVKNYALKAGVTTAYIYKMIKQGIMNAVTVNGVLFIDKTKHPNLPNR